MNRRVGAPEVVLSLFVVALALAAMASGHEDWTTTAIWACFLAFLIEPLLVFAHELGHAGAALALTRRPVQIRIGEHPAALRFAIGKIAVAYSTRGYLAHCELGTATLTPRGLFIVALAGPAVSVALGLGLTWFAVTHADGSLVLFWSLALAAGSSLLMGAVNAMPFRRLPDWWPGAMEQGDGPSDGYLALLALRAGLRSPEPLVGPSAVSEGLTEAAKRVVAAAGKAARAHNGKHVGTEHLLLGLLDEPGGVAASVLRDRGVVAPDVHAVIARHQPPSAAGCAADLVLTPAAKRTLHRAKEALTLRGDQQIDTEHILLGLVQERESAALQVMGDLGVHASHLRHAVLTALHQGADR